DGVADLDVGLPARSGKFAQRDAPLGLRPDVDHRDVLFDPNDCALDDGAFLGTAVGEGLIEHFRKVFARRRGGTGGSGHEYSSIAGGAGQVAGISLAEAEKLANSRQTANVRRPGPSARRSKRKLGSARPHASRRSRLVLRSRKRGQPRSRPARTASTIS